MKFDVFILIFKLQKYLFLLFQVVLTRMKAGYFQNFSACIEIVM